jgi:hypothetical protein
MVEATKEGSKMVVDSLDKICINNLKIEEKHGKFQ